MGIARDRVRTCVRITCGGRTMDSFFCCGQQIPYKYLLIALQVQRGKMLITRQSTPRQRRHRPRPLHSSKPLPLPFGSTASSSHMSADAFPFAVRQLYSGSGPGRHPLNLPITSPPPCAKWLAPKPCMPCATCPSLPLPNLLCIGRPPHEELALISITSAVHHARDKAAATARWPRFSHSQGACRVWRTRSRRRLRGATRP